MAETPTVSEVPGLGPVQTKPAHDLPNAAIQNQSFAHLRAIEALRAANLLEEAEALAVAAAALFRHDAELLIASARIADDRRDWAAAAERWAAVIDLVPEKIVGWLGQGQALRHLSRHQEADVVFDIATKRFPDDFNIAVHWGLTAHVSGQLAEALRRWTFVRETWPNRIEGWVYCAAALRELDRLSEANTIIEEAESQFPNNQFVAAERARIATHSKDWPAAVRIWRDLHDRFPAERSYRDALGEAEIKLAYANIDSSEPVTPSVISVPPAQTAASIPAEASPHDLFLGFGSLGCDCEFGLVQRHFGAEPLGLFRWTSVGSIPQLTSALQANLAGIGNPDSIQLVVEGGEYYTVYNNYQFAMHTFIKVNEVNDQEKLLAQLCRRAGFLRRAFFETVSGAERILLYKDRTGAAHDIIIELDDVLRGLGNKQLVIIQEASPQYSPGTLEEIRPGLLIGRIERFGNGDRWNIDFDGWLTLCRSIAGHPGFR